MKKTWPYSSVRFDDGRYPGRIAFFEREWIQIIKCCIILVYLLYFFGRLRDKPRGKISFIIDQDGGNNLIQVHQFVFCYQYLVLLWLCPCHLAVKSMAAYIGWQKAYLVDTHLFRRTDYPFPVPEI